MVGKIDMKHIISGTQLIIRIRKAYKEEMLNKDHENQWGE